MQQEPQFKPPKRTPNSHPIPSVDLHQLFPKAPHTLSNWQPVQVIKSSSKFPKTNFPCPSLPPSAKFV